MCQASCHFAAVEADAKNVTGSVAAWNNRTSSAYSDVSDKVFSGCLVRRLSDRPPSDRKLVPTNRSWTKGEKAKVDKVMSSSCPSCTQTSHLDDITLSTFAFSPFV